MSALSTGHGIRAQDSNRHRVEHVPVEALLPFAILPKVDLQIRIPGHDGFGHLSFRRRSVAADPLLDRAWGQAPNHDSVLSRQGPDLIHEDVQESRVAVFHEECMLDGQEVWLEITEELQDDAPALLAITFRAQRRCSAWLVPALMAGSAGVG